MPSNRLPLRATSAALMLLALRLSGCVDELEIGRDELESNDARGGEGGDGGGIVAPGGAAGEPNTGACVPMECQSKVYACGDCVDNDGDGPVDAADVECTGPCDDTEDSFFGGIPGQNNAPCKQDCFFDGNSGSGDDECYWTHECDVESVPENGYPPSGDAKCEYNPDATVPGSSGTCAMLASSQADKCNEVCRAITPNGCDCFGCCELRPRSNEYAFIGSTIDGQGSCNASNIENEAACRPCTPVLSCFNACEVCEYCVGGVTPDPSCGADGGVPGSSRCEPGVTPCGGVNEPGCPLGQYCITGCCIFVAL